ncbi:MAG: site-specific integrase [Syntrophales bacterium]|nr:site-specific integrase [Syntrophales bacterium]
MPVIWKGTNFTGVRYYEHPTRKHGVGKDKYFSIRYQRDGKRVEEGIGWTSELDPKDKKHWTAEKVAIVLAELKEAARGLDKGAVRLSERRDIEDQRKEAEQEQKKRTEKENITFGDFVTKTYLPQSKLDKKERTYTTEEMLYRGYLADTIGALPFPKISAFHLERIKKSMADQKKSDRTIQYALQLTRHVFHTARKLGVYAGESPTNAVKWPRLDNMKLRYLSFTEAETLLAALAKKSQNLHDAALLSLHCGLRFGEIASLTWSCVNSEAGTLVILNAKTGSRTAYLTERAKEILQAIKKAREEDARKAEQEVNPDELIFPKRSGKDGVMAQASKVFADTVKELGLNRGVTDRKQKVTFHTLRHSMATHLYESTHDLYLVQRSLGHATGTMTARYAKMSESRLREGATALEKAFATNAAKQAGQEKSEQAVNGVK